MASLDEYLKGERSGRSVQGPPVAPRQIGNPTPGALVTIDPSRGIMPFLFPQPTTPAPQGMSGRGRPAPFSVPESTPRAPKKNPLDFLGGAPASPSSPQASPLGAAQYPPKDTLSNLGDYVAAQDLSTRTTQALGAAPAISFAQQTGGTLINPAIGDAGGIQSVVAQPPTLLGYQSKTPQYQSDYRVFGGNGEQGSVSVTGPDRRVGGGTLSAPDQGNGGTVEGNVAAINRQTEALRSLREARNPGITTGEWGQPQEPKAVNPYELPGDSRLDTASRQQTAEQGLANAMDPYSHRGGSTRQRMATVAAAQGLAAPGMENAKLFSDQRSSKDNLAAHLATATANRYNTDADLAQRMLAAQRQAGVDQRHSAMDNARLALEQRKQQGLEQQQEINITNAMVDIVREGELAGIWKDLKKLQPNDPRYKKLSDHYMLLKRGMEPKTDLLSALAAQN